MSHFTQEQAQFLHEVIELCSTFEMTAVRTADTCPVCDNRLPFTWKEQGLGVATIHPGVTIAFMLCTDCGRQAYSDHVQDAIGERLRQDYEQVITSGGLAGKA